MRTRPNALSLYLRVQYGIKSEILLSLENKNPTIHGTRVVIMAAHSQIYAMCSCPHVHIPPGETVKVGVFRPCIA